MVNYTLCKVLVGDNGERYEVECMNLSEGDIAILIDLYRQGDNLPSNIAENIDKSRVHVSNRLSSLHDDGLTHNKGGGVWTLTPDGVELARALRGSYDAVHQADDKD